MAVRVTLRDFRSTDAGSVQRWFTNRTATRGLLEVRQSFSPEDAAGWVARAMDTSGEDRKWAITVNGEAEPIGFAALYGLFRQTAPEIGVLVGDERRWGRGVGREAVRLALSRAFAELGAHRVYARVASPNDRSRALFEGLGFRREGVMRDHLRREGETIDVELYGLIADEWDGGEPPAGR